MPHRISVWSCSVAEVHGDKLSPEKEEDLLVLISKPFEWRKNHVFTLADPFMISTDNQLWLFVEQQSRGKKGEICAFSTKDKKNWVCHGVVLSEPFHISYPQVFAYAGAFWMIPEVVKSGAVWLYRAEQLPGPWERHTQLLATAHADPTMLFHKDKIYLWATDLKGELRLYFANHWLEALREHPCSPVTSDPRYARCGGRIMKNSTGFYIRLAQDGSTSYGQKLHALRIHELTPTKYKEEVWREDVIPGDKVWNVDGRHHLETIKFQGSDLRAIDGRVDESIYNIPFRLFWRSVDCLVSFLFK